MVKHCNHAKIKDDHFIKTIVYYVTKIMCCEMKK